MAQDPDADVTLLRRQPFDVAAITIKPEGSPTWQWYMIRDGTGRKIARLRVWPNGKRQVQCHKKLTPAEMFAVAVAAEKFEREPTPVGQCPSCGQFDAVAAVRHIRNGLEEGSGQ